MHTQQLPVVPRWLKTWLWDEQVTHLRSRAVHLKIINSSLAPWPASVNSSDVMISHQKCPLNLRTEGRGCVLSVWNAASECWALQITSHSHGSPSCDWVFLTGYKWRQTHWGRNCTRSYPISRCILKILEELSTFTFRQPTRWVCLTNSKALAYVNLLSFIVQRSTYSVWEINIPNIVWDSCGMR